MGERSLPLLAGLGALPDGGSAAGTSPKPGQPLGLVLAAGNRSLSVIQASFAGFADGVGWNCRYPWGAASNSEVGHLLGTIRAMRLGTLTGVAAMALLATGCAVAPHGRGSESVTHDVVDYFQREWPLAGPPTVPADACQGGCSCCGGSPVTSECDAEAETWDDDWNQPGCLPHAKGYTDDPPPAVPLEPGLPGRFFPVPVRPAFAPQSPTGG